MLQTLGPKGGVAQERCQFEEREAVFGEDIERVPEQFIGAGSKAFKMPALFEDLREFPNLDKAFAAILLLQRIQADGEIEIRRLDDDQPFAQILLGSFFLGCNRRKHKASKITMQIETRESTTGRDILLQKKTEQRRHSGAGFTEYGKVLRAAVVRNPD